MATQEKSPPCKKNLPPNTENDAPTTDSLHHLRLSAPNSRAFHIQPNAQNSKALRFGADDCRWSRISVFGATFSVFGSHARKISHRIQKMPHRILKFCTTYSPLHRIAEPSTYNRMRRIARLCDLVQTAVGGADFQYPMQHVLYSVAFFLAWPPNTERDAPNTEILHRRLCPVPTSAPRCRISVFSATFSVFGGQARKIRHRIQKMLHRILKVCTTYSCLRQIAQPCQSVQTAVGARPCYSVQTTVGGPQF